MGNSNGNLATQDYMSSEFIQQAVNNGFQNTNNAINNGFQNVNNALTAGFGKQDYRIIQTI